MKVLDSCCVFQFMKDGIVTMIDLFCGGFGFASDNNRLALLQFSTKPFVHYFFNEDQSPGALKLAVQNMTNFGGRACTGVGSTGRSSPIREQYRAFTII